MHHRLKIDGVASIELKCEECFQKTAYRKNKYVTVKLCNINIIIHKQQHSLFLVFRMFVGSKAKIFREIPPLEAQMQQDDTLLFNLSVLNYCSNITKLIPH